MDDLEGKEEDHGSSDQKGNAVLKIVDLSMTLSAETKPPLDYPRLKLELIRNFEEHGFVSSLMSVAIHTGTHVDSPSHLYREGDTIDQVSLERVVGPGKAVDLRKLVRPGEFITVKHLQDAGVVERKSFEGVRLLLCTGWADMNWDRPWLYQQAPHLTKDSAEYLRDMGIDALGVDFTVDGPGMPVHLTLLAANIPLIECLVNISELIGKKFSLYAAPVKVKGADGGQARAFAILE